ncbi:MAG: hypothetical protein ACWGQW_10025 [bacterium]
MIHVKCNRELTEKELLQFHRQIGAAFQELIWLGIENDQLCVSYWKEYNDDGELIEVDKTTFNVRLLCRYYGPEYERGPAAKIVSLGWFLELITAHVGGQVYYYGDSDNRGDEKLFDAKAREELMVHFALYQHRPYEEYFDEDKDGPDCPLCKTRAIRYGWGGNYAAWFCPSCPRKWEMRDSIISVVKPERR